MSDPVQDLPAAWQGILQQDERIVWQGRPAKAFFWHKRYNYPLGFAGLALVGYLFYIKGQEPWVLPVLLMALCVSVFGPPVSDAIKRRYSFFTLTDRQAFIGTDLPVLPRRLTGYLINAETELTFDQDSRAAVYFAHRMQKTKGGHRRIDIGFENIPDASHVFDLMTQIKEGTS